MTEAVAYQLFIELSAPAQVTVGRFGRFDFPAGRYVYTGSARRNLVARISRHLARHKRLRWHIDYLLTSPSARVAHVRLSRRGECALNQATRGAILVPGFGASDCDAGCGSHLKYLGHARAHRQ
jgi:Uri superfamily endonuclease